MSYAMLCVVDKYHHTKPRNAAIRKPSPYASIRPASREQISTLFCIASYDMNKMVGKLQTSYSVISCDNIFVV